MVIHRLAMISMRLIHFKQINTAIGTLKFFLVLQSANDGRYDWSEELQGFILGAFFLGYMIAHIPGGIMSSKYGSKYLVIASISITSLSTLLTPIAIINGGAVALIILRIVSGLAEGVLIPTFGTSVAAWVPLCERSKIINLMWSGAQVINVLISF